MFFIASLASLKASSEEQLWQRLEKQMKHVTLEPFSLLKIVSQLLQKFGDIEVINLESLSFISSICSSFKLLSVEGDFLVKILSRKRIPLMITSFLKILVFPLMKSVLALALLISIAVSTG